MIIETTIGNEFSKVNPNQLLKASVILLLTTEFSVGKLSDSWKGLAVAHKTNLQAPQSCSPEHTALGKQDRWCYLLETLWGQVLLFPPKNRRVRVSFLDNTDATTPVSI